MKEPKRLDFVKSYLTLAEVSPGLQWDRLQIVKAISSLPTVDCLYLLSRLDHFLWSNKSFDNSVQQELVEHVFTDVSLKHYLIQELRSEKEHPAVFHPQQIYLCTGLLLRYGNQQPPGAVNNELLDFLGKVLLQVSGLCEEKSVIYGGSPSHQRKEIVGSFWQTGNLLALYNMDLASELARSHLVYTGGKEGKELSSAFQRATGVDLLTFWSVVFALYTKWQGSPV